MTKRFTNVIICPTCLNHLWRHWIDGVLYYECLKCGTKSKVALPERSSPGEFRFHGEQLALGLDYDDEPLTAD